MMPFCLRFLLSRRGAPISVLAVSLFLIVTALAIWRSIGISFSSSSSDSVSMRGQSQTMSLTPSTTTVCLVLGEMLLRPHGHPSANLRARIQTAKNIEARYNNMVPRLHVILSGGDTARLNKTEASVMNELWLGENKSGKDSSVVLHLEQQSLSTCQNAFYSIPILQQLGASDNERIRIILVTSDYHAPRAQLLFDQVFFTQALDLNVEIVPHAAPTQNVNDRARLFENERYWLQPKPLERLLNNMTSHPFILPTAARIQQARDELEKLELS